MLATRTLKPRQVRAAKMIAAGHSFSEVSRQLDVSRATLLAWRQTVPAFNNAIEEALAGFEADADAELRIIYPLASEGLRELLSSRNEAIKLGACRTVLDSAERMMARRERLAECAAIRSRLEQVERMFWGMGPLEDAADNETGKVEALELYRAGGRRRRTAAESDEGED